MMGEQKKNLFKKGKNVITEVKRNYSYRFSCYDYSFINFSSSGY